MDTPRTADAGRVTVTARLETHEHVAGDGLLHPVALGAIALLILNDHFLKKAFPGFVTGKLSDVAGLVFFPLLVLAAWEVVTWLRGRQRLADRRVLAAAVIGTAVVFSSMKLLPAANEFGSVALGALQWLAGLLPMPRPVPIALDPSDLIALPALLLAYAIGARRAVEPD